MKTFEEYKAEFERLKELSIDDTEGIHIEADELLCKLCFDACVNENITPSDVTELIEIYNDIEKWYA